MNATPTLPALLESYFTQRLMAQRQASPHTIASYRDTFRLLLNFAHEQCGKSPSSLNLTDLDAPLISAFLDTLEQQRGSAISSRNVRLTAIRSFFPVCCVRRAYAICAHSARPCDPEQTPGSPDD